MLEREQKKRETEQSEVLVQLIFTQSLMPTCPLKLLRKEKTCCGARDVTVVVQVVLVSVYPLLSWNQRTSTVAIDQGCEVAVYKP